jgi:hypothetical protein
LWFHAAVSLMLWDVTQFRLPVCTETSVIVYQSTQRHIPQEQVHILDT